MHPSFLRQSKIANFSTLEQYQLYNEVQRAKREIRIESTIELANHEKKKTKPTKIGFGAKIDIYG